MRCAVFWAFGVAVLSVISTVAACAQEEVVRPGETYNSLQAGQDAYGDAEAQRRAKIGRQLILEDQIQAQNTWSDPQGKYRPVQPESYGPIRPQVYLGPTLADVYAYPQSAIVYYNAAPATPTPVASGGNSATFAAPVPVFQPWPRVPGDIWGTPYYGYVRQPIGHVKIWTGRLSYIYKPVYAAPAMESAAASTPPLVPPAGASERSRMNSTPPSPGSSQIAPPPPKPSLPLPGPSVVRPNFENAIPARPEGGSEGQEI